MVMKEMIIIINVKKIIVTHEHTHTLFTVRNERGKVIEFKKKKKNEKISLLTRRFDDDDDD
mgnify:CR=1 FL=1